MFIEQYETIVAHSSKTVSEIEVRLIGSQFSGQVQVTDLMLQGGRLSTNWMGHPSEQRWGHE